MQALVVARMSSLTLQYQYKIKIPKTAIWHYTGEHPYLHPLALVLPKPPSSLCDDELVHDYMQLS